MNEVFIRFLLLDRDNKRCHLSDELQKLAYSKASLSPVQSISPLSPLSAAEALTSVMARAGRKSSGNLLSFTVGVVAVLWSWWQAAKGVSIQQEQLWGCTGFLLCFWQSKAVLPSPCPAELSEGRCSRCSLAKSLMCLTGEVPGHERETLVSCSAPGAHAGWQHGVLLLQSSWVCLCSVVQPWV